MQQKNVCPRMNHGGGKVMVWGCVTSCGFGWLVHVNGNMNVAEYIRVLKEGLFGTLDDHNISCHSVYFQQDNNPKHTSAAAQKWFKNKHFSLLRWPADSPDMNIMENVWNQLEVKYNCWECHAWNPDELFEMLQEEWGKLSQEYYLHLYESMPHRVGQVIKAKDKWTRH